MEKTMTIDAECRYFLGDRPCTWHKKEGVKCRCRYYEKIEKRMLIIKLDAMGDVLRTTCLLPCIAAQWPLSGITWITRRESVPMLEGNPYLAEVIEYGPDALLALSTRRFDRIINLDAGKISAGLASMAKAQQKIGYVLNERGFVEATGPEAEAWLKLGLFDDMKSANRKTYQDIMCSIVGVKPEGMKYVFELSDPERERGGQHLQSLGVRSGKRLLGIHTGAGSRWPLKQLPEKKTVRLIRELLDERGDAIQIVLLGGPEEAVINQRIKKHFGGEIFDAGSHNGIRQYAAIVSRCDLVLSGDTLAMHVALAMGRTVVALFGPTSPWEIELFGMGEKIVPGLECVACYRRACERSPNCMDVISTEEIKEAIMRNLG
jgi:ADP-heptose:LPS heptosyltransferase